jgi:hypothetical protein
LEEHAIYVFCDGAKMFEHTTDSADIIKTLERFVTEKDFYPKVAITIQKSRTEEHTPNVFESRFLTLMTQLRGSAK